MKKWFALRKIQGGDFTPLANVDWMKQYLPWEKFVAMILGLDYGHYDGWRWRNPQLVCTSLTRTCIRLQVGTSSETWKWNHLWVKQFWFTISVYAISIRSSG